MKKFIMKNKKACIIGLVAVVLIMVLFFIIIFIIPSFGNNMYGHRLDDIDKYKITNANIDKIKNEVKSKDGVVKITYRGEGRVLNFIITVEGVSLDDAKKYADLVIDNISEKNLKYYDVQIYLDSKDNEKDFPIIGYKNKSSDTISWGNVGGGSE